ncbi:MULTISPECIES: DUF6126 family protein [Streptomyces]|uniref:DUF6126 family protein n=1 Tax=Streptomyces TaxID=1883 RepID=UPI000C261A5A|nr:MULTISPECIES: DUF6126 family protein [Streptomyces]MBL3803394.1 hypothetical protein [Streptomyces sp. BRB081]NEE61689.1 hypothetical protein [Streptomyces sp. SID8455]PJM84010.1 hypothetical protein CH313_08610 [Streptomyces sp. TSRI0384-2]GFH68716.1 hypothetical protein Srut_52300 [Streptomyces rutgersensis]
MSERPEPETVVTTEGERARPRRDMEERLPPSLWIRLLVYVVVGHLLGGFLYLLFEVGSRAQ